MTVASDRSASVPLPGSDDTIAAIATTRGRGALSMVRLSGRAAHAIARRVLDPWREEERHGWLAALHDPESGELIDRGIAMWYRAPSSYTGEDMVEISVHGGQLVPAMALAALVRAGAREALPGEFTRRAVLSGRMDLIQAEAVGDLVDAGSRAMHRAAVRQLDGALSRRLGELRDAILELEALIAYDIDFPDEDEGPVAPERVRAATARVLASLDSLLATAHTGELLREGAAVVIAGPPNAGKSSLFNALIGSARAIVTEIPGTTRDALEAVVEVHGWPVRLVDTAGLRESADVVERLGIEVSERWLESADLVLACAESDEQLREVVRRVRDRAVAPVLAVRTKADLARGANAGADGGEAPAGIAVSVESGAGLGELAATIASVLGAANADPSGELPLLTRDRHHISVRKAREEVARFQQLAEQNSLPAVIGAVHLRSAAFALEELIGQVEVEDVLDRVFGSFCVGK